MVRQYQNSYEVKEKMTISIGVYCSKIIDESADREDLFHVRRCRIVKPKILAEIRCVTIIIKVEICAGVDRDLCSEPANANTKSSHDPGTSDDAGAGYSTKYGALNSTTPAVTENGHETVVGGCRCPHWGPVALPISRNDWL